MHFMVPWSTDVAELYELFFDDPLSCPWAIVDLLEQHNLASELQSASVPQDTLKNVKSHIEYINSELPRLGSVFDDK